MTDCEITELPTSMCAHCTGAKSAEEEAKAEWQRPETEIGPNGFRRMAHATSGMFATFESECPDCRNTIFVEDPIARSTVARRAGKGESYWVHEKCAE